MNKRKLINEIARKESKPFSTAEKFIDAMIECISNELENKAKVKIVDFGVFEVARRAPRKGFSPLTREEVIIPTCNKPVFKPGKKLKEIIKNIQD